MDPVDALSQLEERLHSELLQNPKYVALLGVKRTLKETVHLLEAKESQHRVPPPLRVRERTNSPSVQASAGAPPSQADAAFAVLNESDAPLPIGELVSLTRARGATVGGANPELNLSSSLSRDGRFGSVRYNGRPCWTINGKPYSGHLPMESATENDRAELMGAVSAERVDVPDSADTISH